MNANQHLDQDDLALFAMQLLSPEENAEVTRHLEGCAECSRELAALHGDLAIYAHTVDQHSPPSQARERLMKQVAREKKIVPISRPAVVEQEQSFHEETPQRNEGRKSPSYFDEDELPQRSFISKAAPWVGWLVAAGIAVAAGRLYQEREALRTTVASEHGQLLRLTADAAAARELLDTLNDASAMQVTLQKPKTTPAPQARTIYVADKGSLVFVANNMEPLLPYKVYELWLIPADGRDPIPAGTFRPDAKGNGSIILPTLPKGIAAKTFGVTVEDEGGASTPTLPIIIIGT